MHQQALLHVDLCNGHKALVVVTVVVSLEMFVFNMCGLWYVKESLLSVSQCRLCDSGHSAQTVGP